MEHTKVCSRCGKHIQVSGLHREDYVEFTKKWGYFSAKDGQNHHVIFCEVCYDEIVSPFQERIEIEEENELL